MYQSGRVGDEAKKCKSQTRQKRGRVGITVSNTFMHIQSGMHKPGLSTPDIFKY